MGRYITTEAIKIRLAGKVRFTDDPEAEGEEGKMGMALLNRLINEAESEVELDLSPRYAAPFLRADCAAFSTLPQNTRVVVQTLCELKSVMKVLETDFGRGSAIDGSKYSEAQDKRYTRMVWGDEEKGIPGMLSIRKDTYNTFRLPPLAALKLNYQNEAADTGFAGIAVADSNFGDGAYPAGQINDPSEDLFNVELDETGRG